MKAADYKFESDDFFTHNDIKALIASLQGKKLRKTEKRIVYHNRTSLTISWFDINEYRVDKAVSGGTNYLYSCFFSKSV